MADGPEPSLTFPDAPKLELDELIDQLVARAHDVKRAQGRLRALLRAIDTVTGDLDLGTVLRNVVAAARDLAAAAYGALGVLGSDDQLEQFIHIGIDESTAALIGPEPQGKGLLGALISDPRPIRLAHLSDDPRSAGFPPHHPPMESFLGVPIRVGGEVFGNLYLADSAHGEFSAEDEELVVALAAAAAAAISNARLYEEATLQRRWLEASVEIAGHMLAPTGEEPLRMIARRAFDIAGADLVSLGLLTPDREALVVEVAVGSRPEELIGRRFAIGETLARQIVDDGVPVRLAGAVDQSGWPSYLSAAIDVGPLMSLPLRGSGPTRGLLTVVRRRGRPGFSSTELAMAAGFAAHASVALELADSRAAEQRLILLEDRDRIARDLHDHVIQELFAIGLNLEGVAQQLGPDGPLGQRVSQRVDDLDRTIRRIRTSIFELRGSMAGPSHGLRDRILEVTTELTPALGFPPNAAFSGVLDLAVDDELADDVIAVVREGLTNVAKHADASAATVDVVVGGGEIVLSITDNGRGLGASARSGGCGIANLTARAAGRAGQLELVPAPGGGTRLTWRAPVK
jgi:signal transduction histidine kinase